MDLILATDWINNAYPEMDLEDANKEKKEQTKKQEEEAEDPSWISLINEEMKREPLAPIGTPKKCGCAERRRPVPLVDHLCKRFKCSAHELHVLFKSIEKRRDIVEHLRSVQLRTAHLRPSVRNFPVRCNDLSILDTHSAPAYRGYLGITVRMHYYIKHGIRLRHPNLPCMYSISNCTVVFKINVQPLTREQFLTIAQRGANTEYNPRRFHAIIMRIRTTTGKTVAALVFQSARVVLTGVPHPSSASKMAARVLRRIQHTQSIALGIHQLRVVNNVGVQTFPKRISVERLQNTLGEPPRVSGLCGILLHKISLSSMRPLSFVRLSIILHIAKRACLHPRPNAPLGIEGPVVFVGLMRVEIGVHIAINLWEVDAYGTMFAASVHVKVVIVQGIISKFFLFIYKLNAKLQTHIGPSMLYVATMCLLFVHSFVNDNLWTDLSRIYLYLELSIEKPGANDKWVAIEDADTSVSAIQGIGQTFVQQLKVTVGNTEVYDSGNLYPFKAYITNELSFPINAKKNFLGSTGYYHTVNQDDSTDDGFKERCKIFKGGKNAQFLSRLDFDLGNQELYLLNNLDLLFTIYKAKDVFLLQTLKANDSTKYRLTVHDVKIYAKMVEVQPSLNMSLYKTLEKQPATYAVRKTEIKSSFISVGRYEFEYNVFSATIPRRVTIALVGNSAFHGDYKLSPFMFEPFDLREISIHAGGVVYPAVPYKLNFSKDHFVSAFVDMYEALGMANSERSFDISMAQFKKGWTFFVIPLTSTLDDSCGFELLRSGTTNVRATFNSPIPLGGVEMIVLGEFDQMIMVDYNRHIVTDSKLG
ncbi:hypothetical protein niasHT_011452 [Heterodera trifolii]|uniref:Uncharacterized protein n=1 Tax=Heterodera trifolii TaxID=157864 RepID=A0ABD2L120_9BILA